MFAVKENSWHYTFANYVTSVHDMPENLCPYVRRVLLGGLLFTGTAFAILAAASLIIFAHVVFFMFGWDVLSENMMATLFITWLLAGMGIILTAANVLTTSIQSWRWNRKMARWEAERNLLESDRTPDEPGLIMSYIKAVHDKVCPRIEIEAVSELRKEKEAYDARMDAYEYDEDESYKD